MGETLGGFEKLMLLAVLRLGERAWGAEIFAELEARTHRSVSPGAVYVALRRLEKKGLLVSRPGPGSPERGGRARKIYSMRPEGLAALREARREWDAMAEGLDAALGLDT